MGACCEKEDKEVPISLKNSTEGDETVDVIYPILKKKKQIP